MTSTPWHKHYHADALNSMASLSVELRGVYYTLLDMMYDARGPLSCSDQMFAARMMCSVRKWKAYRNSLIGMGKIHMTSDGKLFNKRAEKELKTSRKLAENGAKGGRRRAENSKNSNENSESAKNGFKPDPKPQKPDTRYQNNISSSLRSEDGVSDQFEDAWKLYQSCPLELRAKSQSKQSAKSAWATALKRADAETLIKAIRTQVEERKAHDGRSFMESLPAMHRWLSKRYWENVSFCETMEQPTEAEVLERRLNVWRNNPNSAWPEKWGPEPEEVKQARGSAS